MNNEELIVDVRSILGEHHSEAHALDNPLRHKHLVDLVLQSFTLCKSTSQPEPDLDAKISFFQQYQHQTSKIDWSSLSNELQRSQPVAANLEHLNDIIARRTRTVAWYELGVDKSTGTYRYLLHNIGYCLHRRFLLTQDQQSNEDSIPYLQRAIALTEASNRDGDVLQLADRLADLASSLSARFDYTKQLSDLDDAVSALRRSVSITPPGDESLRPLWNRLGEVLWRRFEVTGSTKDLEGAIQAQIAGSPVGE